MSVLLQTLPMAIHVLLISIHTEYMYLTLSPIDFAPFILINRKSPIHIPFHAWFSPLLNQFNSLHLFCSQICVKSPSQIFSSLLASFFSNLFLSVYAILVESVTIRGVWPHWSVHIRRFTHGRFFRVYAFSTFFRSLVWNTLLAEIKPIYNDSNSFGTRLSFWLHLSALFVK